jgi:hypothetical protein
MCELRICVHENWGKFLLVFPNAMLWGVMKACGNLTGTNDTWRRAVRVELESAGESCKAMIIAKQDQPLIFMCCVWSFCLTALGILNFPAQKSCKVLEVATCNRLMQQTACNSLSLTTKHSDLHWSLKDNQNRSDLLQRIQVLLGSTAEKQGAHDGA